MASDPITKSGQTKEKEEKEGREGKEVKDGKGEEIGQMEGLHFPSIVDRDLRLSYRVGRGEQGVLTFEPYKSMLLPMWRFRTPEIARTSAARLFAAFHAFGAADDFVGQDMARKYIQMGMTRAKRYANYRGGFKYLRPPSNSASASEGVGSQRIGKKVAMAKSLDHEGKAAKEEASRIFKEYWERCRSDAAYQERKAGFLRELAEELRTRS